MTFLKYCLYADMSGSQSQDHGSSACTHNSFQWSLSEYRTERGLRENIERLFTVHAYQMG